MVALVVLTPPLSLGLLNDHRRFLDAAASADGLTVAPAALLAALCLYTSWRLSAATFPGWLVAGLSLVGVQSLAFGALKATANMQTARQHGWMALGDLIVLAILLFFARYDGRGLLRLNPAGVGAVTGMVVGLSRVAVAEGLPVFDPVPLERVLFAVAALAMAAGLAREVVRGSSGLPLGVRARFVAAIVIVCLGHVAAWLDGAARHPAVTLTTLACCVVAAAMLASAGLGTLRLAVADDIDRTSAMLKEFEQVRADHRHHRERLHEISSTIAGIRSAGELLRDSTRIDPERRRLLEEMVHSEICRLERLLSSRSDSGGSALSGREPSMAAGSREGGVATAPSAPAPMSAPAPSSPSAPPRSAGVADLDDTIATLVLLHEAKGSTVRWQRSGRKVRADADDVAEVLNILLDNAARHGDGTASVEVLDDGATIEILVTDDGPGVAREVRDRLFQWGVRGPASPGQGIGLHIASSLVSAHGGYLELRDGAPGAGGSTFVVGLPAAATPAWRPAAPSDVTAGWRTSVRETDGVLA